MKRIFKIFAISFVCLCSALTITSCKKHKHSVNENEWAKDSSSHWHACEGCDELFELDIHAYGAFTKDANECKQTRACTVCGFVQTQTVAHTWGAWANRADGSFGKECTHCHTVEHLAQYYVKGAIAGNTGIVWDKSDAGKLSIDATTMVASITLDLAAGDQFKVGTASGWEFNATNITLTEGLEGTDNVEVKVAGNYTITVSKLTEEKHVCAVVLNAGTDEPAIPPVTDEPTQGPTQNPATPPATNEPTQGPTQDPAPTPGEGDEPSGEPVTTYTVTYNKNGHGVETVPNLSDVSVLPALPTLTETGWIFGGWFYDVELTDPATAGESLSANVTLYAKWTEVIVDDGYENLTFNQWGGYTVTKDEANKTNRVTYSAIGEASYSGVTSEVSDLVGENNTVTLTITNNGENTVHIRYEVGYTESGVLVSKVVSATGATYNGSEHNATAYIEAGASLEVTLVFDTTTPVTGLNLLIDSAEWKPEGERGTRAGDVTVSKVSFSQTTIEETKPTVDWSKVDALTDLVAKSTDKYTVTAKEGSYRVVYTAVDGATYTNIDFPLTGQAVGMNYLALKLVNNGTTTVKVRVDVLGQATNATTTNTDKCNVSATLNGEAAATDLEWGGSSFYGLAAGSTSEIVIYYEGFARNILVYFDSFVYDDTNTGYSGDVTISDIKFAVLGELNLPEHATHSYAGDCDTLCDVCNLKREATADHAYDDCADAICNVCEAERTAPGHNFEDDDLVPAVEAKCETIGNHAYYYCDVCYKYFTEQKVETRDVDLVIPALGHSYGTLVAATTATCEEDGYDAHYHCVCGKYFTEEKVETTLAALTHEKTGHAYGAVSYTWGNNYASCTATKVCGNDAEHVVTETVNSVYEVITDATADSNGSAKYTATFTKEGFETKVQEIILQATGHQYSEPVYNWEWDEENKTFTCQGVIECTDEDCDLEITENGTVTSEIIAATCTVDGKTVYTATFTNSSFKLVTNEVTITAPGHDKVQHEAQAVTCTEIGWEAYETCSRCDYTTKVEIPALTHDKVQHEAQAETCTEVGWEAYETCSRCDYTTKVEIPALGHSYAYAYDWADDYSTCTATITCTRNCGTTFDSVNATVTHTDDTATCTEGGEIVYTATFEIEGHNIPQQVETVTTEQLGHSYEYAYDWADDYSTCTATITCKRNCGATFDSVNATVTHTDDTATCTEAGVIVHTATFNAEGYNLETQTENEDTEALGHIYSYAYDWADDYSTCTVTITCTRNCGATFDSVNATVTHTDDTATCTEGGEIVYTATFEVEGHTIPQQVETVTTNKLEHNIVDVEAKAATCTEDGYDAHKKCDRKGCNTYFDALGLEKPYAQFAKTKLGHSYSYAYDWADDYSTCTATITCTRNCGTTFDTVNATVTHTDDTATCTEAGVIVHTATFNAEGYNLETQTKNEDTESLGHDMENGCTGIKVCKRDCCAGKLFNESEEIEKEESMDQYGHKVVYNGETVSCSVCNNSVTYYYVKGNFLTVSWGPSLEGRLEPNLNDEIVSLKVNLAVNNEFKVCTSGGWENNAKNSTLCDGLTSASSASDANIKVTKAGYYLIIVSKDGKCTITYKGENNSCEHENTKVVFDSTSHTSFCLDCRMSVSEGVAHTLEDHAGQTATCTAIGWNAYQTCSECAYSTYAEIAKVEHDYVSHAYKAVECEVDGNYAYYTCNTCTNYFTEAKELSSLENLTIPHEGHKDSTPIQYSSTKEDGHKKVCSVCHNPYGEYVAHTPNVEHADETTNKYCKVCNLELEAKVGHTHTYDQEVVADKFIASPKTCTSYAKYYLSCSCGEDHDPTNTFDYVEGGKKDHTYDVDPNNTYKVSDATCQIQATYKKKCTNCDTWSQTDTYYAGVLAEHIEGTVATTTTKAICSVCKKEYGSTLTKITVYFSTTWGNCNAYAWTEGKGNNANWPGVAMKKEGTNEYGQTVYSYVVDYSQYNMIIFNNGSNQTSNISLAGIKDKTYFWLDGNNVQHS